VTRVAATTVKVMARQAAGQARLLYRALRAASRLLADAGALGIEVPSGVRRRRRKEKEEPKKPGRKPGLKQVKEEE